MGDTLKAADLPEVEGVTYLVDGDYPLLTVVAPAAEVEEEPIDLLEGEELEGEEVEGAEGESAEAADDAEAEG